MANFSLGATTSTGTVGSVIYFDSPAQLITLATFGVGSSTGAGVVALDVTTDGVNFSTLSSSTHSGASTLLSSTSANLVTGARATLTAHTAGAALGAVIVGK